MKMVSILITPNIHNSHHHKGITDPWPMLLSCFLSSEPYRSRPLTSYSVPLSVGYIFLYFRGSHLIYLSRFDVSLLCVCFRRDLVSETWWIVKKREKGPIGNFTLYDHVQSPMFSSYFKYCFHACLSVGYVHATVYA